VSSITSTGGKSRMKANDGSGDHPGRDEWETPQWLYEALNKQYRFDFDCCANENNKKCDCFFTDFSRLTYPVIGVGWMNPPFSKAGKMFSQFFKVVKKGVAIYRCDNMETFVWQSVIFKNADWVFIPHKRITYEGLNGKGARFPSALFGVHVPKPKGLKGVCLVFA
jgi:hypothetical protein